MSKLNPIAPPPPAVDADSIVALETFIEATRDAGYRSTATAIAELIDNALDAGATCVDIDLGKQEGLEHPLVVAVQDNGCGMDAATLRQALRFGGSSRFNQRSELGRYGMGLPNSSLSQARRVDVYSWQGSAPPITSYLDVDEIASGRLRHVPEPDVVSLPELTQQEAGSSGTAIVWSRCDRLDFRRASTIARKLRVYIGRVYRHYLWRGVEIFVNGSPADAIDPLFLDEDSITQGGRPWGQPMVYEVRSRSNPEVTGEICVQFSELPVEEWHHLSNAEKRRMGVTKGAGVSIVRGEREIEYGWFFMGSKRKENYDDWWRCEIRFDPILDEYFGITHTKQGIRPDPVLNELLVGDLELAARALNSRVRRKHKALQSQQRFSETEQRAEERDHMLPPLTTHERGGEHRILLERLADELPQLRQKLSSDQPGSGTRFCIIEREGDDASFFDVVHADEHVLLRLDPQHPFHRKVYTNAGLRDSEAKAWKGALDLLLLAAARAEAAAPEADKSAVAAYRTAWSRALATYLQG